MRLAALLLFLLPLAGSPQAQEKPLSRLINEEILMMQKAGLSSDVILAKIQTSPCQFDTAPAALAQLKAAGVPETVILAMINKGPNDDRAPLGIPAPKAGEVQSKAKVYAITIATEGKRGEMALYCDRILLGKVRRGRYMLAEIEPGRHLFHNLHDWKHGVEVDLQPGGEYYISCHIQSTMRSGLGWGRPEFPCTLIHPEQAKVEMERLRPLDSKDIRDPRVVRPGGGNTRDRAVQ